MKNVTLIGFFDGELIVPHTLRRLHRDVGIPDIWEFASKLLPMDRPILQSLVHRYNKDPGNRELLDSIRLCLKEIGGRPDPDHPFLV